MYTKDDFRSDLQKHLASIQRLYNGGPYYGYDESEMLYEACEAARYEIFQKAELLGWETCREEFEQHSDDSELPMIELLKKWIRNCDDGFAPKASDCSQAVQEESDSTPLSPAQEKAYRSYEIAEHKLSELGADQVTDANAYSWLKEHGVVPADCDDDYDLPAFETWQRYVRAGRSHYSTNKNSPRAGRTGRSVVRQDQI